MAKVTPAEVLGWAEVAVTLFKLGIIVEAQLHAILAGIFAASQHTDLAYAAEDFALSAETHSILQGIIAQAQRG